MIALILAEGADVHATCTDKKITALHEAARDVTDPKAIDILLEAGADPLAKIDSPGQWMTPFHAALKYNPNLLETDAGRRLARLTAEGTGCEGVFVLAGDTKLALMAERVLGDKTRWKEIAELNGLGPDKGYRKGDCLKMP